mgnify:FL=1
MTKKILTLEDASIGYSDTLVLDGLNWTIGRGERWAITGPNGCGKTTLMRTLLGLLPLRAGRLTRYDREEAPTQGLVMSYLPQINQIDRHFPIYVEEIIASGLPQGLEKHRRLAEVERLAEVFGITTLLRQPLGRLSGGQLQRTLLARSLASDPELLILDEPLSFLDRAYKEQFEALLQRALRPETTLLMVTHDLLGEADASWQVLSLGRF